MTAKLIVFPVKGRNWCFTRSIDSTLPDSTSSHFPSTFKGLFSKLSFSKSDTQSSTSNAELVMDFISLKMNKAWTALEKAPHGTLKNKIYGVGLQLLSRVKPSEIFLKSISKDVTNVEITYPPSLNARLVRRRIRHVAQRGAAIHKNYFYGSASLLPVTAAFAVLPLPNVPFFWVLFRTYSHWRALKGSEKLLQLVSDDSHSSNSSRNGDKNDGENSDQTVLKPLRCFCILQPSKELEDLLKIGKGAEGLSKTAITDICKTFHLNTAEVLKYRDSSK